MAAPYGRDDAGICSGRAEAVRGARISASVHRTRCWPVEGRSVRGVRQRRAWLAAPAARRADSGPRERRHRRAVGRRSRSDAGISRKATASRSRNTCPAAPANGVARTIFAFASRPTFQAPVSGCGTARHRSTCGLRCGVATASTCTCTPTPSCIACRRTCAPNRPPRFCRFRTASSGPIATARSAWARRSWCRDRVSKGWRASSRRAKRVRRASSSAAWRATLGGWRSPASWVRSTPWTSNPRTWSSASRTSPPARVPT